MSGGFGFCSLRVEFAWNCVLTSAVLLSLECVLFAHSMHFSCLCVAYVRGFDVDWADGENIDATMFWFLAVVCWIVF